MGGRDDAQSSARRLIAMVARGGAPPARLHDVICLSSTGTSCGRPSARRPDRLAVYMGCCADRRQGHVTCATHNGRPTALDTAEAKAPPRANHEPLRRPPRRGSLELRSCSSSGAGVSRAPVETPARQRSSGASACVACRPLLLIVQLSSKRRPLRGSSRYRFRERAAVWTCALAARPRQA